MTLAQIMPSAVISRSVCLYSSLGEGHGMTPVAHPAMRASTLCFHRYTRNRAM